MSRVTVPLWIPLTAAVLAAVFLFATGPRRPLQVAVTPTAPITVRGAFHVHTTDSDGALPVAGVAAAAARAGLRFVVITDHGDATTVRPPKYVAGVLIVSGVEISTRDGHYIALAASASPYPLGGDAAAVAEDVARLGGFGVAAHPFSARSELAWHDWRVPVDGLEWMNADSAWRDEPRRRLARAAVDYLWHPVGALASLLDRPVDALARWDELASRRQVFALAGHDAHGGFGEETDGAKGRRLHLPTYEESFRTFSNHVSLDAPLTGEAAADAPLLLGAIRAGRVFTAIDALASPASLEFLGRAGGRTLHQGEAFDPRRGAVRFHVRAPLPVPGTSLVLLRNGITVQEGGRALDYESAVPGAYRAEVRLPNAPGTPPVPWIVSNPIYLRRAADPPAAQDPRPDAGSPRNWSIGPWRVEAGTGSTGRISTGEEGVTLQYELAGPPRASQFVALAADLESMEEETDALVFEGHAARPMRVSVQLRFGSATDARWTRSIYLDTVPTEIRLPLASLRAAASQAARPPLGTASSILFVVDLTNARPGDSGRFTIRRLRAED